MRIKNWLLKYYSERYGIKKTAKNIGMSANTLDKILTKKTKIGNKNKEKLIAWQESKRYNKWNYQDFKREILDVATFSQLGITKIKRLKLRKLIKERATARPRFKRIKKSLIKKEVERKGISKFSKDSGISKKEVTNLLRYPTDVFIPKDKDVSLYLNYQKEFYDSKRGQVISNAKKLSKTKIKKYKIFANKDVRYFTTGTPYVVLHIPVNSRWINVNDNPRVFDRLSREVYSKALHDKTFRKYATSTGSLFGKILFESIDDRDKIKWKVHESAPQVSVNNYSELKAEMFGMIDYLIQLAEIFVEGKEGYHDVRILNVSLYMKFKEEYNVTDLRSKKRL